MTSRHIQTIFCDDIRYEEGGKMSFIGVYSTEMYVNKFPAVLPKLGISVSVLSPSTEPLSSIAIRILKDDDVLQEIVVNEEQLKEASQAIKENANDDRLQVGQFIIMFSPLILNGPCRLKVRVLTECDELRGPGLDITTFPST